MLIFFTTKLDNDENDDFYQRNSLIAFSGLDKEQITRMKNSIIFKI